jgi:pimeloyl-ACP methyl ester carboxylesterase
LWLHASSWGSWEKCFQKAGYETLAPGWPGEPPTVKAANADPESVAGYGLDDVADHYESIIKKLDDNPIIIGHSFGGLIVQKLLADGIGRAGVAIDPAPAKGVIFLPPAALQSAFVVLKRPANYRRSVALTEEQFYNSFANELPVDEAARLYKKWAIPSPGKLLFEDALANFAPNSPAAIDTTTDRGPLLITGGGKDRTVPASLSRATYRLYRKSPAVTDYKEYWGKGHSLIIDSNWREVADDILTWLKKIGEWQNKS